MMVLGGKYQLPSNQNAYTGPIHHTQWARSFDLIYEKSWNSAHTLLSTSQIVVSRCMTAFRKFWTFTVLENSSWKLCIWKSAHVNDLFDRLKHNFQKFVTWVQIHILLQKIFLKIIQKHPGSRDEIQRVLFKRILKWFNRFLKKNCVITYFTGKTNYIFWFNFSSVLHLGTKLSKVIGKNPVFGAQIGILGEKHQFNLVQFWIC